MEWEDIHQGARVDSGVLSTEINHAVAQDAVLVHHVFANSDALVHYFSSTATEHMRSLTTVARPDLHILRNIEVPARYCPTSAAVGRWAAPLDGTGIGERPPMPPSTSPVRPLGRLDPRKPPIRSPMRRGIESRGSSS